MREKKGTRDQVPESAAGGSAAAPATIRAERLAAALRENLCRRKAQARGRADDEGAMPSVAPKATPKPEAPPAPRGAPEGETG